MSSLKPLKLWVYGSSPNPWKTTIILAELGLPYECIEVGTGMKEEPYLSVNPNGRAPAMEDPNTGIVTWESGSNIEYLIDVYDKEGKISYTKASEKYAEGNWKHFQMSGQGPYYGQLGWFLGRHPERIQSAIERYGNELKRVLSVIDLHLNKTGKPYLIGDRCTYVDLMWVPWNSFIGQLFPPEYPGFSEAEWREQYPKCYEWHQRLMQREHVKSIIDQMLETFVQRMKTAKS